MTKLEAEDAMRIGKRIRHDYYSDDEFLYLDNDNIIRDENDYNMGSLDDDFWSVTQEWNDGWSTYTPIRAITDTCIKSQGVYPQEIYTLQKLARDESFHLPRRHSPKGHKHPFRFHK